MILYQILLMTTEAFACVISRYVPFCLRVAVALRGERGGREGSSKCASKSLKNVELVSVIHVGIVEFLRQDKPSPISTITVSCATFTERVFFVEGCCEVQRDSVWRVH